MNEHSNRFGLQSREQSGLVKGLHTGIGELHSGVSDVGGQ